MNSTAFQQRPRPTDANSNRETLSEPSPAVNRNPPEIHVSNFKPLNKGAARGVFDLQLGDLRFAGCMLLEADTQNGPRKWFNFPAIPQYDRENKPIRNEKGKQVYKPVIEFSSRQANDRIQAEVLAAIDSVQGGDR